MSAKTYRLPEPFGGGELVSHVQHGTPEKDPEAKAGFYVEGEIIWIPTALLEEVPLLPEEPPPGAFVAAGGSVYQRRSNTGINWLYCDGQGQWYTWAQICAIGSVAQLAEKHQVELPWAATYPDCDQELSVIFDSVTILTVGQNEVFLNSDVARSMGYALISAADVQDAQGD